METYWNQLSLYSGMISTSVVLGGIVPLFFTWIRRYLHLFLSFSAGLMLGATVIHLFPEAFEILGARASFWVLAGFLFLYIFQKFLTVHICEMLECEVHKLGISAGIGIFAHSLTDGIALGSGLLLAGGAGDLGLIVFLTIFFHKMPEAFALTCVLMQESHSRSRIVLFNLLLILTVPLGALLVRALGVTHPEFVGIALAFSAGTFLHVSLSDLLPHVHEHAERQAPIVGFFLLGLAAMYGVEWFLHNGGHAL
jgi:zinc and cadmium transporter